MSTRLARSAGLIGAATLTSRVLGVVREIVLAALFGAGNQMDAFNVAFSVPNLLRDLFAEGAMSAAFVPAFTRRPRERIARERVAARQSRHQRAHARHADQRGGGLALRAGAGRAALAPEFAAVPGKLELTVLLTRIMLPFLATVAVERRDDGHAQRAAAFLHSCAVARDVQRRDDRLPRSRSCR